MGCAGCYGVCWLLWGVLVALGCAGCYGLCRLLWWLVCALLLQVFVHYLFQALRVVAMTLVSAVSTPGHRDDGIYFLSFLLNDLIVLLEYFMGESEFKVIDRRQCLSIT